MKAPRSNRLNSIRTDRKSVRQLRAALPRMRGKIEHQGKVYIIKRAPSTPKVSEESMTTK